MRNAVLVVAATLGRHTDYPQCFWEYCFQSTHSWKCSLLQLAGSQTPIYDTNDVVVVSFEEVSDLPNFINKLSIYEKSLEFARSALHPELPFNEVHWKQLQKFCIQETLQGSCQCSSTAKLQTGSMKWVFVVLCLLYPCVWTLFKEHRCR